jgi:hypothetical protein
MIQYYMTVNELGFSTGFYVDAVHGPRLRPVYVYKDVFETQDTFDAEGQKTGEVSVKVGEVAEQVGFEPNTDCTIPADAVAIAEEQHQELLQYQGLRRWEHGAVVPYEPPAPPITQADYSVAIQLHLDAKARERQYDGIQTAITYRDDPNQQFAAEGEALFAWRSAVWTYSTAELQKVMAGERTQPGVAEFIAELPTFIWPVARA